MSRNASLRKLSTSSSRPVFASRRTYSPTVTASTFSTVPAPFARRHPLGYAARAGGQAPAWRSDPCGLSPSPMADRVAGREADDLAAVLPPELGVRRALR